MMKQKKADPLDAHLGARLRKLRMRRGLSMAQMGEIIEVTPQQVSRYESGQHRMTAAALFRLARGLDMPISWFFDHFHENPDELKRLSNAIGETRARYSSASTSDQEKNLISLWNSLPKESQKRQIIDLLESFV